MANDVGDGLGDDAERRDLGGGRQLGQVMDLQVDDGRRTDGQASDGFLEGAGQAELVDRGWTQALDDPAYLRDRGTELVAQVVDEPGCRAVRFQYVGDHVQPEQVSGQGRSESVMEVPPQSTAFFLSGQDHTLQGVAQLDGEVVTVESPTEVHGKVLHEAPLRRAHRRLRPKPQDPDSFPVGHQGNLLPGPA